jgi:ATP synthase protein I
MSRKEKSKRDPSKAKLDDLQQRVEAQREAHRNAAEDAPRSAWQLGMRYGSEFFAGVLVGGVLGFVLDYFAPTSPWGLFLGTMLGFAAGTLNVVRAANEINSETSAQSGPSSLDK